MAVILVYFLVQYATEPVYHLVESVRGGVKEFTVFRSQVFRSLMSSISDRESDGYPDADRESASGGKGALSDCGRKFPGCLFYLQM